MRMFTKDNNEYSYTLDFRHIAIFDGCYCGFPFVNLSRTGQPHHYARPGNHFPRLPHMTQPIANCLFLECLFDSQSEASPLPLDS